MFIVINKVTGDVVKVCETAKQAYDSIHTILSNLYYDTYGFQYKQCIGYLIDCLQVSYDYFLETNDTQQEELFSDNYEYSVYFNEYVEAE